MSIHALLQAFFTILPAELPDKSMFATLALAARFRRPGWVWVGASLAFALHVTVAVAAGSLIGLLPDDLVQAVVGVLFLGGAVLLFRQGRKAAAEGDDVGEVVPDASVAVTVGGSFAVIALAEWGDLTQIATASLAATSGAPIATGLGAWLALATVAGIAALFGRQLVERVALHKVNYVGATIFAALGVWTLVDLAR